jgi:hypothetical protein
LKKTFESSNIVLYNLEKEGWRTLFLLL